ncbi:MAG: PA2779 family protein [Desulfobacterium sp.]|nr:PA2779 family protein [Desulfobacterium sp.]
MTRLFTRSCVFLMIGIFLISSAVVPSLEAKMINTTAYLNQEVDAARGQLVSFLARDDVRGKMTALGVSPDDAANRVAALTDQEVSELQSQIDQLPAGSGVLAVLGVVLVVLIVLELVGVTNVFNRL